jgi:hypothetical protein
MLDPRVAQVEERALSHHAIMGWEESLSNRDWFLASASSLAFSSVIIVEHDTLPFGLFDHRASLAAVDGGCVR